MLGYPRGVRDYNDAFAKGNPTRREEVVDCWVDIVGACEELGSGQY